MKYWKRQNPEGNITTVESYSFDDDINGAIEIDGKEFTAYINSLPKLAPLPTRNILEEIDQLKLDIATLKTK
jgi:hypothetical protein